MRKRVVIVNGDDFGLSPETNAAIVEAFGRGLISSATVIANVAAFEDAARLAREHSLQRRIGLHVNVVSGTPLTAGIASCPRFCDAGGMLLPRRRILVLSGTEQRLLQAEIEAQIDACKRARLRPTHLDSHYHMHTEWGIAPVAVRAARRRDISGVRLAVNCGRTPQGVSRMHRGLGRVYRGTHNIYLRRCGLAKTDYFGDALDTINVLRTRADVEVMVHPRYDNRGELIDLNGERLESRIAALGIAAGGGCSYYGL